MAVCLFEPGECSLTSCAAPRLVFRRVNTGKPWHGYNIREIRNAYRISMGKLFGKQLLVKMRRWKDNNKDVGKTDCDAQIWMKLSQDHVQWQLKTLLVFNPWILLSESLVTFTSLKCLL
jgi:hypothetical protein